MFNLKFYRKVSPGPAGSRSIIAAKRRNLLVHRCRSRNWTAAAVVLLLAGAAGCSGKGKSGELTIAVIPKGTTHEFWKAIHAGAVKAERELNASGTKVSISWKGPLREDDREQQVQVVEGFVSQNVSGIVIAPLDESAIVRPVERLRARASRRSSSTRRSTPTRSSHSSRPTTSKAASWPRTGWATC
jgi:hypothetical protein